MTDHDSKSQENIAQLSRSLEQTMNQNRTLVEKMARFAQDESLRFAHLQLDHADQAFSHFRERRDLSGLIGAQQEWIKEMMQEYATLSLRYAEMFHTLAQHVQSHVESAANDFQHRAEEMAGDLARAPDERPRPRNGGQVENPHLPAE